LTATRFFEDLCLWAKNLSKGYFVEETREYPSHFGSVFMTEMNRLNNEFFSQARHQTNEQSFSDQGASDTDTRIAALMTLTGVPNIAVTEPEVDFNNGTLHVSGMVDAFWKRAYLGDIMKNEFPDLYVENTLTVIPPREGEFPPEKNPVTEPGMFQRVRAKSSKNRTR
jgi:hypothetical protein